MVFRRRRIACTRRVLEIEGEAILPGEWAAFLSALHRLTLIEILPDPQLNILSYYVTPLVRDLLAGKQAGESLFSFSQPRAGAYYYHIFQNIDTALTPLEEAFYHYDQAENKEMVQDTGDMLSNHYFDVSLFRSAFYYAGRVVELLGKETNVSVLGHLGSIYKLFGDYDRALALFQEALPKVQQAKDKKNEGVTLNNISSIFQARGDYDKALSYLEQSLEIRRQLGDKSGSSYTLHNMAGVAYAKDDFATFLKYETESYSLALEVQDAMGLFNIGGILGYILCQIGNTKEGIAMLERSVQIGKAAGFPDVAKVEKLLLDAKRQN